MWGAGAPSLPFPFRAAHAPGCGDPFPHGRRVRFPPLSRRQEQVPLSLSEERYHSRQGKGNRVGEQNERANGRSLSLTPATIPGGRTRNPSCEPRTSTTEV